MCEETRQFSEILKKTIFTDVFKTLCFWYKNQERNKEGYLEVYNKLLLMTPWEHDPDDLIIVIEKRLWDGKDEYLSTLGIDPRDKDGIKYGLELIPWNEVVSLFISENTMASLKPEEIVAAVLFEITFYGFTEEDIKEFKNRLEEDIDGEKS